MIAFANLKELFSYNEKTGVFTRNISTNKRFKVGDKAGSINSNGYVVIKIKDKNFKAHRLVWLFHFGVLPPSNLDHINGIKSDNRIENLRLSTFAQNNSNVPRRTNNKSGYKGVIFHKATKKWMASCSHNKKRNYLGLFDSAEEANCAYVQFAKLLHGEFFAN